jgi:transcription elongation GreA/GreB family factor
LTAETSSFAGIALRSLLDAPIFRAMHPDVAKLVDANRIPKALGERLTQLSPGQFCLHKSFGVGKVREWDLAAKRVVIDFEKSANQVMDLQFALQKTEWIPADDFRAKKIGENETLRELSGTDPAALVVHLLRSHNGRMTADEIERELSGAVIPADAFKKWWDDAKKRLKESRKVVLPQKRTDPLVLRGGDQSPAEAMLAEFEAAKDIKGMIRALEAIAADIGAFDSDVDALKHLLGNIDGAARKAARVQLGQALQLVAARDEVIGSSKTIALDPQAVTLAELIRQVEPTKLADDAALLPSARQRAVYEAFPEAYGNDWVSRIMRVFDRAGARGVGEITRILIDKGSLPALLDHLRSAIARRALGTDALIWVCRERKQASADVFSADVGASVLNLLENDHLADGPRKTSRLQALLGDDKTLLTDLVEVMDANEARNFARRLLECPVFGELERKSLMARIIKARPETVELVSGESQREESLLVSWPSLEKKKAELDEIVRVRIPQNTKDISIARSYGDLRENFEYKSAKDMQKYLGHRKNELEREIGRARGTDFKGAQTSAVNIGTIVTLTDANGTEYETTVLGAWDSDPETRTVSYLSEVGKALMNRKPGDEVAIPDADTGVPARFVIRAIRAYHP